MWRRIEVKMPPMIGGVYLQLGDTIFEIILADDPSQNPKLLGR